MSSIYGFVYIWFDRRRKMYYIGSHKGHPDDGYICSSTWMRNTYNRHKEDFRRRIIAIITEQDRKLILAEEQKWLSMIKQEELGKKYYNLREKRLDFLGKDYITQKKPRQKSPKLGRKLGTIQNIER